VAQSARDWLDDEGNVKLCARLRDSGVRTELADGAGACADEAFAGKQFVLTGRLETLTRDEARAAVEARGGRITSTVSKKTDYVVAGEEAGSKLDKAQAVGVKVIDEETFRGMIR
jgi:DNA ligase (NAD+)